MVMWWRELGVGLVGEWQHSPLWADQHMELSCHYPPPLSVRILPASHWSALIRRVTQSWQCFRAKMRAVALLPFIFKWELEFIGDVCHFFNTFTYLKLICRDYKIFVGWFHRELETLGAFKTLLYLFENSDQADIATLTRPMAWVRAGLFVFWGPMKDKGGSRIFLFKFL